MVLGRDRVQGREPVGRSGLDQVQDRTTPIPGAYPRKPMLISPVTSRC